VTRALEHAASGGVLRAGTGVANQRLGAGSTLRVVDAIISGVHEAADSHHELLRAFTSGEVLRRMDEALESHGYRTHEFGDSVLVERRCGLSGLALCRGAQRIQVPTAG
jgi:S-adenosylmethionine:tRNA ribosyltransferase-isomerase